MVANSLACLPRTQAANKLVHGIGMVLWVLPAPMPLSFKQDGLEHVDRRGQTFAVQFTTQDDLAFGDVTRQVRNRMVLSSSGMDGIGTMVMEPLPG